MRVHINVAGTVSNGFQIGKTGPSILQGNDDPPPGIGSAGDLYVKTGVAARLFVKQGDAWLASGDTAFGFVRDTVALGEALAVGSAVTYVGVTDGDAVGDTTILLPMGTSGKRLIVKDESGRAGSHAITLLPGGEDSIDDAASLVIDRDHGAVILVYDNDWHVIGRG